MNSSPLVLIGLPGSGKSTVAAELATLPCESQLAEVDYRANWFGVPLFYVYPSASFPEVTLTTYCVK